MFYLALTFGLRDDPIAGVERMIGFIERVGKKHGVAHPLQMTLAILDGRTLYAFRYSSEGNSRTLFHSADIATLRQRFPNVSMFSDDARAVVSEPLGAIENIGEAWVEIPEVERRGGLGRESGHRQAAAPRTGLTDRPCSAAAVAWATHTSIFAFSKGNGMDAALDTAVFVMSFGNSEPPRIVDSCCLLDGRRHTVTQEEKYD